MLVAIEAVRKASTNRPVGISNVRIVESSAEAISHLESGEKHCHQFSVILKAYHMQQRTLSNIRSLNPRSSRTNRLVSKSTSLMTRSSHVTERSPLSRCKSSEVTEDGNCKSCTSCVL